MNSIRSRILLFFTLFAIASLIAVYQRGKSTEVVGDVATTLVNQHVPMVQALGSMQVAVQLQDNALYRYLTTRRNEWLDACEKARLDYMHWFALAQELATQDIEQDKLREIDELYFQYDNQVRQIFLTAKPASDVRPMLAQSDQYLIKLQTNLDEMEAMRQGMTVVRRERVREILDHHRRLGFAFVGTIAVFFFLLALYLLYFLVRPFSYLLDGIRGFTRGNTDVVIPRIGKDELGELQEAFNEMSREIASERKRLRTESQSDPLTGLFNMRYFRLQLVEEFSRSQRYGHPMSLLMIDVDYFKNYNDRNGHPAGDIVLKEVARILTRNVRGTDIVARYGGEEFVVLLPETPVESAISVAEKIRRTAEEHHFPFRETQIGEKLTVSIGVGSYPDIQVNNDQNLIEAADRALYGAKKDGRNLVRISVRGQLISPAAMVKSGKQPASDLR